MEEENTWLDIAFVWMSYAYITVAVYFGIDQTILINQNYSWYYLIIGTSLIIVDMAFLTIVSLMTIEKIKEVIKKHVA